MRESGLRAVLPWRVQVPQPQEQRVRARFEARTLAQMGTLVPTWM